MTWQTYTNLAANEEGRVEVKDYTRVLKSSGSKDRQVLKEPAHIYRQYLDPVETD